jgi:hypothetical protein
MGEGKASTRIAEQHIVAAREVPVGALWAAPVTSARIDIRRRRARRQSSLTSSTAGRLLSKAAGQPGVLPAGHPGVLPMVVVVVRRRRRPLLMLMRWRRQLRLRLARPLVAPPPIVVPLVKGLALMAPIAFAPPRPAPPPRRQASKKRHAVSIECIQCMSRGLRCRAPVEVAAPRAVPIRHSRRSSRVRSPIGDGTRRFGPDSQRSPSILRGSLSAASPLPRAEYVRHSPLFSLRGPAGREHGTLPGASSPGTRGLRRIGGHRSGAGALAFSCRS